MTHTVCNPALIVGLGNPGDEYSGTRHNVGFMVVDRLLAQLNRSGAEPEHIFNSHLWQCRFAGRTVRLQLPLTFMNCSGTAVAPAVRRWQLAPQEVLLIYDDLDLPLGRLRLRRQGGSGGHRGVESVIDALGSKATARLRIGIGRADGQTVEHVLAAFTEAENEIMETALARAVDATLVAMRCGVETAMNRFNSAASEENGNSGEHAC
jgi:PTH1 family peptidyl-tRNA hydrolase